MSKRIPGVPSPKKKSHGDAPLTDDRLAELWAVYRGNGPGFTPVCNDLMRAMLSDAVEARASMRRAEKARNIIKQESAASCIDVLCVELILQDAARTLPQPPTEARR